jgi:hypothetical protein
MGSNATRQAVRDRPYQADLTTQTLAPFGVKWQMRGAETDSLAKIDPLITFLHFLDDVLAQAAIAFELRFREPLVGG